MEFCLPELGEGVHEGEFMGWKIQPGESLKYDQPLCEIMTDKATVEIPASFEGKVSKLKVKSGDIVHVGQILMEYQGADDKESGVASLGAIASKSVFNEGSASEVGSKHGQMSTKQEKTSAKENSGVTASLESEMDESKILASPYTRQQARAKGIPLSSVKGTGPLGRILFEDLEKFEARSQSQGFDSHGEFCNSSSVSKAQALPQAHAIEAKGGLEVKVPFKGLRKKIAEKMVLSKEKAAHFTYVEECNASALVSLRKQAKEYGLTIGIKVTYLPFIMKAMVAALKKYPLLNATLDEQAQELVLKHYYNIALSIQTEEGLVAPVIEGVEHKGILQLASEIENLVKRAKEKKLTLKDYQNSTITLTNAGNIGGLFTTPVINYPEVAILGFNKIARKPVVQKIGGEEKIVIADWTYFSMSLDHRVVDGAVAAEFMKEFIEIIENPSQLMWL